MTTRPQSRLLFAVLTVFTLAACTGGGPVGTGGGSGGSAGGGKGGGTGGSTGGGTGGSTGGGAGGSTGGGTGGSTGGGTGGSTGGGTGGSTGGGTGGSTGGGTGGSTGGGTGGSTGGGTGGSTGGGTGGSTGGGTGGSTGGGTGGSTGGGTGGSAGGGTGGSAGGGAGGAGGGSVTLPDGGSPPLVTLTFPATCPAFSACGGQLPGTWVYTAGCVDDGEFLPLLEATKLCGTNAATISNKTGTIQGGLVFTPTEVTRFGSGSVAFTVSITGATCANATTCPFIGNALAMYGFNGACQLNTVGTTACVCSVTRPYGGGTASAYTVATNQVVVANSTTSRYDYCVTAAGATLGYHEVTATDGGTYIRDPGYFSLTK